jgi:hypothetical protein
MVAHLDIATPHTAKCTIDYLRANQLMRAPQAACSPDLAPSDFYRFDKLKMMLIGGAFADDELLQGVMEVLNRTSQEELGAVFEEWLVRLDRCIQQNGEYV